jgi:tetratricopeptide (TPR) repeat protein
MCDARKKASLVVVALLLGSTSQALLSQEHLHHASLADTTGLGSVSFPNSGKPAAQAPFQRGLALLHSFEYIDAGEAFQEAQRRDPHFALAYWMEALTNRQGIWGMEQLADARTVLARLAPTADARLARAGTPRERAFGAAVEALFADAPEAQRVRAWADSLRRLAASEPEDPEWATFAAVAIMDGMRWASPAERARLRDESAALAERAFARHPMHPGAAHFVIHANDDPVHAPRAEQAARAYAKIAPAADHALHMPSHIFIQIGSWEDAVASNERAWKASRAWAARRRAGPAELSWHSFIWLQYGYLQQGRRREARALIDSARTILGARSDTMPGIDARFAIAELEFAWGANTGEWLPPSPAITAASASARAIAFETRALYQRTVTAHMRGDRRTATEAAAQSRAKADSLESTTPAAARAARMLSRHLEAIAATADPDRDRGLSVLRSIAAADTVPPLGPPPRLLVAELLGNELLERGLGADAAAAFEQALKLCPGRSSALLGLARARRMAGDSAGAARAYSQLLANWHSADAELPDLAEARAGAARR